MKHLTQFWAGTPLKLGSIFDRRQHPYGLRNKAPVLPSRHSARGLGAAHRRGGEVEKSVICSMMRHEMIETATTRAKASEQA